MIEEMESKLRNSLDQVMNFYFIMISTNGHYYYNVTRNFNVSSKAIVLCIYPENFIPSIVLWNSVMVQKWSKFRTFLQVYFGKTKEMVCTLRPPAEIVQTRLPDSWSNAWWHSWKCSTSHHIWCFMSYSHGCLFLNSMIVAKDWASFQIAGVSVFLCKLVKCFLLFDVFVRSCVPFEAFSITKDLNLTNAGVSHTNSDH